jgi:hypothetical protein
MSSHTSPPRFQFSLRWMLVAVAIVAILLGLGSLSIGRGLIGLLLAISLRGVLPTIAVAAAVYGRGDVQAFAVGAVVCSIPILTTEIGSLSFTSLVLGTISQLIAMALCGVTAVATRRWVVRHGLTGGK